MWKILANKILRNKITFVSVLMLITVFMGYQATKIELTYTYPQILPVDDPTYIEYSALSQSPRQGNYLVCVFLAQC